VCNDPDPPRTQRRQLALAAATELLSVTLDPTLARDEKLARVDALVARSLAYQPGCSAADGWCDPTENALRDATGCGCRVGGATSHASLPPMAIALVVVVVIGAGAARRRHWALAIVVIAATSSAAAAQSSAPSPPPTANGVEPGREVATPTPEHVEKVRHDKQLGPRVGFYTAVAGSFDRGALATTVALRVRITERWIVGFDTEWNPWLTSTTPRAGALNLLFTGIRRWPLTWERVNLRSTLQVGTSILLFDVFGAPAGSVGLYAATAPLGIDVDLRRGVRLVVDPLGVAIPIPHLTAAPFYYPQYRISIGFQFGG
jgi:MYXO-CTERM domain-containing protein